VVVLTKLKPDSNQTIKNCFISLPGSTTAATLKLSDHPQLANFFKMLRLGVPAQAVKLKMSREGFEPGLLDLPPDAPLPKELEFSLSEVKNDSDSSDDQDPDFD
jgi:Subunit CCDC53 of WASH complex